MREPFNPVKDRDLHSSLRTQRKPAQVSALFKGTTAAVPDLETAVSAPGHTSRGLRELQR